MSDGNIKMMFVLVTWLIILAKDTKIIDAIVYRCWSKPGLRGHIGRLLLP